MRLDPVLEVPHLLVILPLIFLAWGAFIAWRWHRTFAGAREVFEAKRELGEIAPHVAEEAFRAGYVAAEAPRAASYAFGAALLCAFAIPPGIALFNRLWYEVWTLSGRFEPAANGTMVHTFSTFLFCAALMVGVLYVAMRHYYSKLPPRLSQVIRDLNGATS